MLVSVALARVRAGHIPPEWASWGGVCTSRKRSGDALEDLAEIARGIIMRILSEGGLCPPQDLARPRCRAGPVGIVSKQICRRPSALRLLRSLGRAHESGQARSGPLVHVETSRAEIRSSRSRSRRRREAHIPTEARHHRSQRTRRGARRDVRRTRAARRGTSRWQRSLIDEMEELANAPCPEMIERRVRPTLKSVSLDARPRDKNEASLL